MQLRIEDGVPYIYAHLHGKQIVKLRMDGTHMSGPWACRWNPASTTMIPMRL